MQINSDNTTAAYAPEPCGLYDFTIKKIPELRANAKGLRVVRIEAVIGNKNGKDIFARDDVYVTENSSWRIERLLRCVMGSVQMDDEKFCSEEFRRSLVGRTGKADIGILLYGKNGQMRKVNEIVNYVSDKNPSVKLDPTLAFTTDNFTAKTTAATARPSAATGDDLPASGSEAEEPIDESDVPF